MSENIIDRLVDVLAGTFTRLSRTEGIAAWVDGKSGLKMPRFVNGGWERLNAQLVKVAEDFIVADAVERANSPMSGMEIKEGVRKLAPAPPLMEKWAAEHMLAETTSHHPFYFDDPQDYDKVFVAVHKVTFIGMYPRTMVMLWSNEYIKSDDLFWLAYGLVTYYRGRMKAVVDRHAYILMKMYINAAIGRMFGAKTDNGVPTYHPWLAMAVCYAHYVMSDLLLTIPVTKTIYADVDVLYADLSYNELRATVEGLGTGLPYEIEYVSEMKVHGRRSYTEKTNAGEWKHHGVRKPRA